MVDRRAPSRGLGRRTRAAVERGRRLLQALEDPALRAADPELARLRDEIARGIDQLSRAPALRIGAARRIQGAMSRRHTAAQALFTVCIEVRRRVRLQFRGPRHDELRHAFGEGMPANPDKPGSVLLLAERILQAAAAHPEALRRVGVRTNTVARLRRLAEQLGATEPERGELRQARLEVLRSLSELAEQVEARCQEAEQRLASLTRPRG
jgi:hypothetical protein